MIRSTSELNRFGCAVRRCQFTNYSFVELKIGWLNWFGRSASIQLILWLNRLYTAPGRCGGGGVNGGGRGGVEGGGGGGGGEWFSLKLETYTKRHGQQAPITLKAIRAHLRQILETLLKTSSSWSIRKGSKRERKSETHLKMLNNDDWFAI